MLSFTQIFSSPSPLTSFFNSTLVINEKWVALLNEITMTSTPVFSSTHAVLSSFSLTIFSLNVFFLLGGFIIFYTAAYGLKTFKYLSSSFDINFTLYAYFGDLEEEMGSADDAMIFFLIIGGVVMFFLAFVVFSSVIITNVSWVVSLFLLSTLAAFLIPTAVLKNFGIAFTAYIRGHGRTSSVIYEVFLDMIAIFALYFRFIVQNMRFIFIFFTLFELYELAYSKISPVLDLTSIDYSNYYWSEFLVSVIYTYGTFLYSIGHALIIFIVQLTNYFVLSFWLFFFLYTTFTLESSEKYFFYKRALTVCV